MMYMNYFVAQKISTLYVEHFESYIQSRDLTFTYLVNTCLNNKKQKLRTTNLFHIFRHKIHIPNLKYYMLLIQICSYNIETLLVSIILVIKMVENTVYLNKHIGEDKISIPFIVLKNIRVSNQIALILLFKNVFKYW